MPNFAEFHMGESEAAALAGQLAPHLRAGDTILLEGNIGAGKTHFARHLIWTLLSEPEDIPSPTFTLVQVYDTPAFEVWHTDLYRLSDEDQVIELGLLDAMETALCLVEWPDRLGVLTPRSALRILFSPEDEGASRHIVFGSEDHTWRDRLDGVFS